MDCNVLLKFIFWVAGQPTKIGSSLDEYYLWAVCDWINTAGHAGSTPMLFNKNKISGIDSNVDQ